jgi:hypothetical protein
MVNFPACSRYSEQSQFQQLQQFNRVSPEPTFHHHKQECTSDEDEEREPSVEDVTHEPNAAAAELAIALETFPAKAILPLDEPKGWSQKLLQGKVLALPKGVKRTKVRRKVKLDQTNKWIWSHESHINLSNQSSQTLYTMASTSINRHYTQLTPNPNLKKNPKKMRKTSK